MYDDLRQLAASVVPNVFEIMFFIFFEPTEGDPQNPAGKEAGASDSSFLKSEIAFKGHKYTGKITLYLPYGMSRRLATDFIGTNEPATELQTLDMAGEITNMIAGNLFSRLDKKEGYTLSIPKTTLIATPEYGPTDRRMILFFDADEERIRLDIELGMDPEENAVSGA